MQCVNRYVAILKYYLSRC